MKLPCHSELKKYQMSHWIDNLDLEIILKMVTNGKIWFCQVQVSYAKMYEIRDKSQYIATKLVDLNSGSVIELRLRNHQTFI